MPLQIKSVDMINKMTMFSICLGFEQDPSSFGILDEKLSDHCVLSNYRIFTNKASHTQQLDLSL